MAYGLILVCTVLLKWVTTVLLLQIKDISHHVVPLEQKGCMRGRQIMEHVWHATGPWHEMTQGFMPTVDFRKAYDSVTFKYLASVLNLMQLPLNYVRLILHVMASPRLYVVDGEVVHEVIQRPSSGIRQGDTLSPALFVLASSQIIIILKRRGSTYRPS